MSTRGPRLSRGEKPAPKRAPKAKAPDGRLRAAREYDDDAVCRARLERDHRAAENIIARRKAANIVIRAQVKVIELGGYVPDDAILVEEPITMTWRQFFIALACRYATNEQIAAALYGRVSEKSLGALRTAMNALNARTDDDFARMGLLFSRPIISARASTDKR